MQPAITLASGSTTDPFFVQPDGWVIIEAGSASATLQYTTGTPADITNGAATWITAGTYTGFTAIRADEELSDTWVKLTAASGSITYHVEGELSKQDRLTIRGYKKSGINNFGATYATDSSGNVTGLVGPTGGVIPIQYPANTISFIGDSMMSRGVSLAATDYSSMVLPLPTSTSFPTVTQHLDRGIHTWCMIAAGQRLKLIRNAGVGGNRTQHVLARIDADVLAAKPRYVACMIGYNNVVGDDTYAQIASDLTEIYAKIRAAGSRLIAFTILPNATFINANAARKAVYNQVNLFIKQYCQQNDGCYCFDAAEAILDVTTGGEQTGSYYTDNIHPVMKGAMLVGNAFGSQIASIVPNSAILLGNPLDTSAVSGGWSGGNMLPGGRMVGTGGANTGVGMSGVVATNWTHQLEFGTATSVASKVARADGVQGEWQQVAISSMTGSSAVRLQKSVAAGAGVFAVGDVIEAIAEFQIDAPTSLTAFQLTAEFLNSGFGTISAAYANQLSDASTVQAGSGVFKTAQVTVPALTAYIVFKVIATGNTGTVATFRVGRCELRKVA